MGINFLTAKTILFFHKNNYKSYQFATLTKEFDRKTTSSSQKATYINTKRLSALTQKYFMPISRIEVICSVGNALNPSDNCKIESLLLSEVQEM